MKRFFIEKKRIIKPTIINSHQNFIRRQHAMRSSIALRFWWRNDASFSFIKVYAFPEKQKDNI